MKYENSKIVKIIIVYIISFLVLGISIGYGISVLIKENHNSIIPVPTTNNPIPPYTITALAFPYYMIYNADTLKIAKL